jgi:hypothetical protein
MDELLDVVLSSPSPLDELPHPVINKATTNVVRKIEKYFFNVAP